LPVGTLKIAGAGMAGLCAAAHARALGAAPVVYEKGTRAGGSMLLSSCVIWRFREWDDYRAECPSGDERLQRTVWQRLDDGIAWLESLGAPVVRHETGNPRTIGKRFDPRGLTEALVAAAGDVRLAETTDEPAILATGGFQGSPELVAEHIDPAGRLRLRANPWSTGDGLRHGLDRGAELSAGMDEFYGRNMPDADFTEAQFVPLAQLYGRVARVFNERGEEFFGGEVSWSENDLVQATARQPDALAWYLLDKDGFTDAEVKTRLALASTRTDPAKLPFAAPPDTIVAVRVKPGITHTIGGLGIDEHARAADGLYAAGADVGGISTGGYASGLAAALVFGRIAAESALDGL
jgi:succinate dehydrogenase/fumarate reductase flavoprotein subunit